MLDTTGKLTLSTVDGTSTYVIYNGTNFVDANFTTTSEGNTLAVQFSAEKRTVALTKALIVTTIDNIDIANITSIEVPKEMDLVDVYNQVQSIEEISSTKHWKHYSYTFNTFEEMYNTLFKVYTNNPAAKIGLNATQSIKVADATFINIDNNGYSSSTTGMTFFARDFYYYVSLAGIFTGYYIMTYYGFNASSYSVAFLPNEIEILGTRIQYGNGVHMTISEYHVRDVEELKTIIFDIFTTPESLE